MAKRFKLESSGKGPEGIAEGRTGKPVSPRLSREEEIRREAEEMKKIYGTIRKEKTEISDDDKSDFGESLASQCKSDEESGRSYAEQIAAARANREEAERKIAELKKETDKIF